MSFDAWDRWEWRHTWEKLHAEQYHGCFPMLPTEVFVTQPFLTLTAQAPSSNHSPPPQPPSCETCSLLVGWRKNPALVLNPSCPTQLLPHTAKNEDCHKQQEPFNNKLLLLCWMFYWANTCELFPYFPWETWFLCTNTTQHSPSLTPPQLIQTAERWGRLRTNCSCIKCFINNVYCCFLLLSSASRGQFSAHLERLVPLFNSNRHRGPGQAKAVPPVTTETPRQAGFLKSSWKWKSLSHSLCLQEAFSNSISAPGKKLLQG